VRGNEERKRGRRRERGKEGRSFGKGKNVNERQLAAKQKTSYSNFTTTLTGFVHCVPRRKYVQYFVVPNDTLKGQKL